jgi:hypothetical protein
MVKDKVGLFKMQKGKKSIAAPNAGTTISKPFYFVTYSTGEPQIAVLIECLDIVFGRYFEQKRTPPALESGRSQHDVILDLIGKCAFGVVCLDGLRPNVVFEYGAMRGAKKPVLLFKEQTARVDTGHFYGGAAALPLPPPLIDMDKHFSDTKDRFYTGWSQFQVKQTVKTIWEEYKKIRGEIQGVEIPEPQL